MQKHQHNTHVAYRGFTLLELIVAIAVGSIITTIGAPAVSDWLTRQRVSAEARVLWRDLSHARYQAGVSDLPVIVCPSNDGTQCTGERDWSRGWISFINIDDDYPAKRDHDEPVLTYHQSSEITHVRANRLAIRLRGFAARATNGRIAVCDAAARTTPRTVVVSHTGRARIVSETNPAASLCN
ncbi:MAG: GspH/FimT family pseudopilin [Pseudomonadota bacterium]